MSNNNSNSNNSNNSNIFVGVDVCKDYLDVAIKPEDHVFRVTNDTKGIASLVDRLKVISPQLVVFESTGGLERNAAIALADAQIPVRIVEPGRIRYYAKAMGQIGKTDRLDALIIAEYAGSPRVTARELPNAETRELQDLLDRRRQLITMRVAEENRLKQAARSAIKPAVKADIEAHIFYLSNQIALLDDLTSEAIRSNEEWRERDELLRTVPGIGVQTSRMFLGTLPELGVLNHKKIASLVGVAPHPDDSGDSRKPRKISRGRSEMRTALYMAAISTIRFNEDLRVFYRRLREAGKAAKVAIIAVARKLLTIANAMVRDKKPWSPKQTASAA